MASAWEQAAEIQPVNQRLRQLQMSMAVGESLHARHLSTFTEEMTLRIASPVFSRIRVPTPELDPAGRTLTAHHGGNLAAGAGHADRDAPDRPAARTAEPPSDGEGRRPRRSTRRGSRGLNLNNAIAAPAPPTIVQARVPPLPTVDAVVNADLELRLRGCRREPAAAAGGGRRSAAAGMGLSRALPQGRGRSPGARRPPRISASFIPHITMSATVDIVRAQMHPRVALANLARAAITKGDNVLPPAAPGVTPVGTETVMMAPSFPQPMYEALKEKSQDLLLPGLDKVLPDTVLGLRTNRAFVEAYMIGLNVEMARELLWRGFPTDQQGTYFRNFWGTDGAAAATADIGDLRQNLARALGTAPPNSPANQFVLLLRSSLLRRYPNAIIYLTPAVMPTTTPRRPTSIRSSTARWSRTSTSSASRSPLARRSAGAATPATTWSSRSIPPSRASASTRRSPLPCSRPRAISRSGPRRRQACR